jgi:hypothetical protein
MVGRSAASFNLEYCVYGDLSKFKSRPPPGFVYVFSWTIRCAPVLTSSIDLDNWVVDELDNGIDDEDNLMEPATQPASQPASDLSLRPSLRPSLPRRR